jgi:hypothetical protein
MATEITKTTKKGKGEVAAVEEPVSELPFFVISVIFVASPVRWY